MAKDEDRRGVSGPGDPTRTGDGAEELGARSTPELARELDELFTVILGFSELLMLDGRRVQERATEVVVAAERAIPLVRELERRAGASTDRDPSGDL